MKEKQHYPSWRYHRSEPARIVENAAEDAQLGDGWANSPAAFAEPVVRGAPPPQGNGGPVQGQGQKKGKPK